jgi:hypothetical protein
MIRPWERSIAADLAADRLEEEYLTCPIVQANLDLVRTGGADLLTGLVECIRSLVKAKRAALGNAVHGEHLKSGFAHSPSPRRPDFIAPGEGH